MFSLRNKKKLSLNYPNNPSYLKLCLPRRYKSRIVSLGSASAWYTDIL